MTNTIKREFANKYRSVKAVALIAVLLVSIFSLPAVRADKAATATLPDDLYGAIAYSPSTRRFGSSWNYRSQEDAQTQAMNMCRRSDCKILLPLENSCGALAVARNGGYAYSEGRSLYEAKLLTSNQCTRDHGGCKLVCSICSRGNEP